MENDNLFDEFDADSDEGINEIKIKKEKQSYTGQKRARDQEETKDSSKKKVSESILNSEEIDTNKEKIKDIQLQKTIQRILPNFSAKDYLNVKPDISAQNSETNPINLGMKIETFQFDGGFHETITSKDCKINSKLIEDPNRKPATTYPFKLDQFQQRAILCLENHQSVLVAAHTSAGKTVVAQYAIAMALRDKQRVIYTSPIKALSNQKYRELKHEFHDVGLMTGDVTLNPTASCIVMTTEILRNMLFKGSEITREMAWVIFDEVHYMRDKDRGVVWEETIILLSNKINYVFLSATIPNAREFAMWISKLKSQPCNVVYTDFRPVPLQHYVYPKGHNGIYLVVDKKGVFRDGNFLKALEVINESMNLEKITDKSNRNKSKKGDQDIKKIVTLINDQKLNPSIVFSFSKKDCEDRALALSKMDFTTPEEKQLIEIIYTKAIQTLSADDQNLPQIQMMLPILKKGIGIHHGGMLPIVKECVELIFQEGLIKTLFSTETFSMGINMPAKTVVFTSVEKWDGEQHRWLGGGEYIQMSGRAGRRGIDDMGITIMMLDKKMDPEVCRNMLNGKADPLLSSFHLNYNQLVNLYRLEGMESEYIVKRSFRQFQSERSVPLLKQQLGELYAKYVTNYPPNYEKEELINKLIDVQKQIEIFEEQARKIIIQPEYVRPFLIPGRMIKLDDFGFGVVIKCKSQNIEITKKKKKEELLKPSKNEDDEEFVDINNFEENIPEDLIDEDKPTYVVDTLVYVSNYVDSNNKLVPGNLAKKDGKMGVVPFMIEAIQAISPIVIKLPENLKEQSNIDLTEKIIREVHKRFDSIPLMDPIKEMDIKEPKLKDILTKKENLDKRQKEIKAQYKAKYGKPIEEDELVSYKEKSEQYKEIKEIAKKIDSVKKLVLQDELNSMRRVLRRLEIIKDDVVQTKGQVACNISSGDELLLTEMIFDNLLNKIEPAALAALLTCFLSNEGSSGGKEDDVKFEREFVLKDLYEKMKASAKKIAAVLIDSKIDITEEEYLDQFKHDYMLPVYNWAQGKSFGEICEFEIYEGNLIRVIRRLDELIKELIECAGLIGNTELKENLEKASELIRKGIPFAASLYLSN